MSNLDNLTKKIIADGDAKAAAIIDDAKREADGQVALAESEANAESRKAITAAEDEAKKLVELALSAKRIEIRDKMLAAKQETVERALSETKKRLSEMDAAAYEAFLFRYLSEINLSPGEKLRVPQAYQNMDMNALNGKLQAAGKPALTLDTLTVVDGFKLIKDDIENDNSFDALIDYYRVTLEQLVVERLFQGA